MSLALQETEAGASESPSECMIGDVNVFWSAVDSESDSSCGGEAGSSPPETAGLVGELEIMIAEPCMRGKGYGREALAIMMAYAAEVVHTYAFVAKIGLDNAQSIHLFESLGFREKSRSQVGLSASAAIPPCA